MPSLKRLVMKGKEFSLTVLIKKLRDYIRAYDPNRKLWVSGDGIFYFLIDASPPNNDEALQKFVLKVEDYFRVPEDEGSEDDYCVYNDFDDHCPFDSGDEYPMFGGDCDDDYYPY